MISKIECLELTGDDRHLLRKVFHHQYWNDQENIYCVPVSQITVEEFQQLNIPGLEKYTYLVANMQ